MEFGLAQRRVLGCLIEKRWTTPDQYPLTLNAIVAAANQKSNRDPVLSLESFEVLGTVRGLIAQRLVFQRDVEGGRVPHFGERLSEQLTIDRQAQAIIAELLLRGPQTAPELLRRAARMAAFEDLARVESTLQSLADRNLVRSLPRASGQRHARWMHLLGEEEAAAAAPAPRAEPAGVPEDADTEEVSDEEAPIAPPPAGPVASEIERLREEVADLRLRVDELEDRLARLEGSA
ncbi:MAG: DUF480 domain-containing protein [Planctomycetes bacterium]|nr:DUF480 domain-containing protein [Planctomycetota bacterium]